MKYTIAVLCLMLMGCGGPKGIPLNEQINATTACQKNGGRVIETRYEYNGALAKVECSFQPKSDPGKPCSDKGGVPILSSWDGTLKDCKFKEATK